MIVAAGCGGASSTPPAHAGTIVLDWHEEAGRPGARLVVDVRRLTIRAGGWSVAASVRNDTRVALLVVRPHHAGQREFGVLPLPNGELTTAEDAGPGVFATAFSPPVPLLLRPGRAWSGTFSGSGRLAAGRYLRVELGRFMTVGPPQPGVPWRFGYVTDHAVRLK